MRLLRTFGVACILGLKRTRAGGARTLLVVAGVSAASALLAGVLVASTEVERQALDQSVAELEPAQRTVRAAWFGVPAQAEPYPGLDAAARAALARVVPAPAAGTVLFRESTIAGAFVSLGAVDDLERFVRLTRGRLPRRCEPTRCEVLQLRGDGRTPRGFVVVGRGRLRGSALFGDAIPADRNELDRARLATPFRRIERYHRPRLPPLLLADGVRDLDAHAALGSSYRSYGWVVELGGGDIAPWEVDATIAEAGRARAGLQARSLGFDLLAPAEELRAASGRAEVGARRLFLLGGQAAALLLAFAAFAATRLRRSAEAADRRLSLLGVRLWPRATAVAAHAVALAGIGVVGAWALATLVVAAIRVDLARAALLSSEGVTAALVLAGATVAVVAFSLTVRAPALRGGLTWLDAVALALLLAIGAALTRGAADAGELLRQGGSAAFLLALPAAVVAVAAILTARLLAPATRLLERALPRTAIAPRLAAVSLGRRPGTGAAAAAFLVISVAVATFAATYRATLERGQREQAAFALGADIVLREDLRRLVPVREVATERRLAGLGDDVDAAPVIRQVANVAGVGTLSAITLLGLEPKLLETLRGSSFDAPDLAFPSELRGPRLPPSARELELGGRSSVAGLSLGVALRQPDGAYEQIELSVPGRAAIPRAARGGTLLGFQLLPPPRLREAGADAGRPLVAEIELEPLRAGGAVVSGYADWVGIGGASFARGRLGVTVTPGIETWFRPRQAIDTMPLPAVVSPLLARLADDSGRLTLQVGGRPVRLEVAGVATRFPSARNDFAVVDRAALDSAMNLAAPGSGFATEAWLDATTPAAETTVRSRLRRAPFDALVLDSRVEREARLRGDPLARGALAMLLVGAAISLLLALLALALAALSDLRDDRRELLDLETQGAAPRLLRRLIRLRQLGAGTLGLVGGLLTGAVLAALVVDVVAVSATGERPVPPLELSLDPIAVVAVVGGVGLIGALVIVATTRGAFRARAAGRPAREDP